MRGCPETESFQPDNDNEVGATPKFVEYALDGFEEIGLIWPETHVFCQSWRLLLWQNPGNSVQFPGMQFLRIGRLEDQ